MELTVYRQSSKQRPDGTIVYITASGTKYHNPGCSYLTDTAQPISLSEAQARGYTPCSRCH